MTHTRRHFLGRCLGGLGPVALAPFLDGCADADVTRVTPAPGARGAVEPWPRSPSAASPFVHGVASGDPTTESVILWTRVTPPAGTRSEPPAGAEFVDAGGAGSGPSDIDVEWRLGLDPSLGEVIQFGSARAEPRRDYTVHVDVGSLAAGTTYYYQFRALGQASVRGRTRTLPSGQAERLRLAITSCANYPAGFFHVFARLARTDLDLVVHLGDYLYEYGNGTFGDGIPIGRAPDPPRELSSLADYRRRHAQYKTDPDLQELHRQHPWMVVWDDHEVADNAYNSGAANHQPVTEGGFQARKLGALQAYREWMPLRAATADVPIYRGVACGDLLDLLLLDTRHTGRDPQLDGCDGVGLADETRQLLGPAQEAWLGSALVASRARGARWRFIGQQVIFAPLRRSTRGCVWSSDYWDGYSASRARLLDTLERERIDNVVILTGDAHASWAMDVPRDPFDPAAYDAESGRGSQLVELVTPAVSSPPRGVSVSTILSVHPHVKFANQTQNGYVVVDVTHERMQAEWYLLDTVRDANHEVALAASYYALAGAPHLRLAEAPTEPRLNLPAPAE